MEFIKPDWKIEAERRGESLPGYYNLSEVAKILDYKNSNYLSRLALENQIPTYKIGKYRFMTEQQVQIFIENKQ